MTSKLLFSIIFLTFSSLGFGAWQQPPEQLSFTGSGNATDIATDARGNAIAIFTGDSLTNPVRASYFSAGNWGAAQTLDPSGLVPFVAMDASGTGLALWLSTSGASNAMAASYFNGSTWLTTNPLQNLQFMYSNAITMNGLGKGLAIWAPENNVITVSFFSGGSWTAPQGIGIGFGSTSVAYSQNGTAIAGWIDNLGTSIVVSNFDGVSWSIPITIGSTVPSLQNYSTLAVGIDSSGHGVAVWADATGNIASSIFNGTTWLASQVISTSSANVPFVSLSMAPSGTAVAVWQDSSGGGVSSSFNGILWETPQNFATGLATSVVAHPSVSVDSAGNAQVIWATDAPQLNSALLPVGGTWGNDAIIDTSTNAFIHLKSAFSTVAGFASWVSLTIAGGATDAFASTILFAPTPPTSISAKQCLNKFPSQTDKIHIIHWTPSSDSTVVSYYLRRNGALISIIPASGPFTFYDHNRCNNVDVYTLTAVNAEGGESAPLTISIK